MKFRLKKGDKVVVTAGKDKGHTSEIIKLNPTKEQVIVQGVNRVKKHLKKSAENPSGKIIEKELPIHISNVMFADPKDGKPTRVGYKIDENGKKIRFAKRSGEIIKE